MTVMMTVTSKGQVTLPVALRRLLKVKMGDRLIARATGSKVIIEAAGRGILDIAGKLPSFKIPKGKTIDDLINEARDEYYAKVVR